MNARIVPRLKAKGFLENFLSKEKIFLHLSIAALILLGILFRLGQYLSNRSLWLDEAMLALNIIHRTLSGLGEPLSYHQVAPVGFLWIEKLITLAFGNTEYSLRLFPLLSGIVALFLFYLLARSLLSAQGVILSLALFVVSDWLIYYTSEVKQYSSDVLIVLLLYAISIPLFRTRNVTREHYLVWGVLGGVLLWFSHPAIFILAAISLALLVHGWRNPTAKELQWLVAGIGIWILSFLLVYWLTIRGLSGGQTLVDFWNDYFMPLPPWRHLPWFMTAGCDFLKYPVGLSGCRPGAVLVALGALSLLYNMPGLGLALILPFLFTLVASGLRQYPFGERLVLFLVPLALILVAEGVDWIRRVTMPLKWVSNVVWLILAMFVLFLPARKALIHLFQPRMIEDIKPILAYVSRDRVQGDQICLDNGAEPAFRYYAPYYHLTEEPCILYMPASKTHQSYSQEIENKTWPGRVWFLFSHKDNRTDVDNEATFLAVFSRIGRIIDQFHSSGASAYLAEVKD